MASQAHFSRMPSINIPRSKMKQPKSHKTSFNHGELVPIYSRLVVPGDTFKINLRSLIRMSNPIRPIMDDIICNVHAFFVPLRLVWSHTEEFFGENKGAAGPQTTVYHIPMARWKSQADDTTKLAQDLSVGRYFGKPSLAKASGLDIKNVDLSILKERAYMLIWNEWYRAQQVEEPYLFAVDGDGVLSTSDYVIGSRNGTDIYWNRMPLAKVNKKFDYFTSATIAPQYGAAVELALGNEAPVEFKAGDSDDLSLDMVKPQFRYYDGTPFMQADAGAENPGSSGLVAYTTNEDDDSDLNSSWVSEAVAGVDYANAMAYDPAGTLVAKLNQATMVNVNELRYAFSLQKWLERSNFGSRYFELLQAHYGVTSPDARLQRPEHIGSTSFHINVSQVLSTAGSAADSSTKVGEPGANSLTFNSSSLFTKGFVEFGYVIILLDTKHERSYAQGALKEDLYSDRFDFYSPEFANIGDQAITNKEIFVSNTAVDKNDKVFGYQEHWAEMRYDVDLTTGLLAPAASSSLNFWTLTDNYSSLPELSEDFLFEDREAIKRALVSGSNGPDYIASFFFDVTTVRPMPAYTIPGLIDHFGAL